MVFKEIARIIAYKLDIPIESITEQSTFEDMQADSLYIVEIMMMVEETFNVDADGIRNAKSVGEIVDYVEARYPQKG